MKIPTKAQSEAIAVLRRYGHLLESATDGRWTYPRCPREAGAPAWSMAWPAVAAMVRAGWLRSLAPPSATGKVRRYHDHELTEVAVAWDDFRKLAEAK